MKAISLIICLLCCYQALAKRPADHNRVLKNIDVEGLTTFAPKNVKHFRPDIMNREAENALEDFYHGKDLDYKLPMLVKSLNTQVVNNQNLTFEMASDYVIAFTDLLSVSRSEGHILEKELLSKYVNAYNDLITKLNVDKPLIDMKELESRDEYDKLNELHRLFENLSIDLDTVRIPEDNI